MIDYFSHVAALRVCLRAITSSQPPDPANPKAVPEAVLATDSAFGGAVLGALFDHVLQYSQSSTSREIDVLVSAAKLFQEGSAILGQLSTVRPALEAGLTTPNAPGVLAAFNAASSELPNIATALQNLQTNLEAFQASFSGNYMAPVGQQQDEPVQQWAWRDIFLGRRTTAFVANVQRSAATTRQKAFALGNLAGAAGNLLGSGYLNTVVGGPRRSHQLRHRLAAYSVGAWFRDHEPQYAGTLVDIRQALNFPQQDPLTLPADLKILAQDALRRTYSELTSAALPDLDVGYRLLKAHLGLLGDFTLPAVPAPMNNTLTAKVVILGIVPGTGQQLHAGETHQLTLDVMNYGSLTAPANCLFFWAVPTTNFTPAYVSNNTTGYLIGQAALSVPITSVSAPASTPPTTMGPVEWTIQAGHPEHICLLAVDYGVGPSPSELRRSCRPPHRPTERPRDKSALRRGDPGGVRHGKRPSDYHRVPPRSHPHTRKPPRVAAHRPRRFRAAQGRGNHPKASSVQRRAEQRSSHRRTRSR